MTPATPTAPMSSPIQPPKSVPQKTSSPRLADPQLNDPSGSRELRRHASEALSKRPCCFFAAVIAPSMSRETLGGGSRDHPNVPVHPWDGGGGSRQRRLPDQRHR